MKLTAILKRITAVIAILFIHFSVFSQVPTGFHYQAVARGMNMEPIVDQVITLHFSIFHKNGSLVWKEKHFVQTNAMGLFSLNICENDDHRSGGNAITPSDIDWGSGLHSLHVELEEGGNIIDLGTHRIMSVPYASYAAGGPDADPGNELQDLQLNGNQLTITGREDATVIDLGSIGGGASSWSRVGNRLFFLDGNVGIGTDNPYKKLMVNGAAWVKGLEFPNNFGPDTAYVGAPGNYLAFGHPGISEDFISYKNNTFYLKDSPGGGDVRDPDLVVGGNLSVGTDQNSGQMTIQASEGTLPGEPLFMIKRSDGYPVFAVYENEVWVYTDTSESVKGLKGGFAVGGYKAANKGPAQEYMRVTPDSIRFYIDQGAGGKAAKGLKGGFAVGGYKTPNKSIGDEFLRVTPDSVRVYIDDDPNAKGLKGGFAVGGYKTPNKGSAQYFNVSGKNVAEVIEGENRVVWYPRSNALLAGNVLADPETVGVNSMSTGYQSQAIGDYSEAFGYRSRAIGIYSTAIGKDALAAAANSVSIGDQSRANSPSSFAFGRGANANGENSYAIGSSGIDSIGNPTGNTIARGENAFAIGMGAVANQIGGFSLGTNSLSDGNFSMAMGYNAKVTGPWATAIGSNASATGSSSLALSGGASAHNALAIKGSASGEYSMALHGGMAMATGSIAIGGMLFDVQTIRRTGAEGKGSIALGHGVAALGDYSTVIGTGDIDYGQNYPPFYVKGMSYGDYSTSIGAFCNSGGYGSFSAGYQSYSGGDYSMALGYNTFPVSFRSMAVGCYNVKSGNSTSWVSTDPIFVVGNGTSDGSRSNAMTILKNGYVGIRTTAPAYRFQIYENRQTYAMDLHNDGNSNSAAGIRISCGPNITNATSAYAIGFLDGDGTWMGSISIRNSQVTFNETSDRRLKTNINPTGINGLERLTELEVVDYAFKERPEQMLTGFIAQDVEQVVPEAVSKNEEGIYELSQIKLIPVLTKAIQEQQEQLEQKDERISELESRLARVEALLDIE